MKRTSGQILMLLLAIVGSLVLGVQGVLPWEHQAFQWLVWVLALLVVICLTDGLILIGNLLFPGRTADEEKKNLDHRKR